MLQREEEEEEEEEVELVEELVATEEQLSDEIRATGVDDVISHGSHCHIIFCSFVFQFTVL